MVNVSYFVVGKALVPRATRVLKYYNPHVGNPCPRQSCCGPFRHVPRPPLSNLVHVLVEGAACMDEEET